MRRAKGAVQPLDNESNRADKGAVEGYAYANVTTSIGISTAGHSESVTISSVHGLQVYLSASAPASVVAGDKINDGTNDYLIEQVGDTLLIVRDHTASGAAPDTGSATITRCYSSAAPITDWEADLDDTDLYMASDDAVGECYNDANFNEAVTIDGGGGAGNLNSVTLSVAEGERHDGTEGTGARMLWNASESGQMGLVTPSGFGGKYVIEWLESDGNGYDGECFVCNSQSFTHVGVLRNLLAHGVEGGSTFNGVISSQTRDTLIHNCVVYDGRRDTGTFMRGIYIDADQSSGGVYNCTVWDIQNQSTGNVAGIKLSSDDTDGDIQNCISGGHSVNSGTVYDFYGESGLTYATIDYCLSSDATADDAGGTNCLINKTITDQFVSTGVAPDLHLKVDADAAKVGTILTTPTGVEVDIASQTRANRLWNMGAFGNQERITSIGAGTTFGPTATINSVSTTGQGVYDVTLSAAPSTANVGDKFLDEAATPNEYLVLAINGSVVTVGDVQGVGSAPDDTSASSTPKFERYYNGANAITDWEADLDNATDSIYMQADYQVGECYNDETINDEDVTIDGGLTVSVNRTTLRAAAGERHDGVEGAGVTLSCTGDSLTEIFAGSASTNHHAICIHDLEFDFNGNEAGSFVIEMDGTKNCEIYRNIIHDIVGGSGGSNADWECIRVDSGAEGVVHNNIIYNIENDKTGTSSFYAIHGEGSGSNSDIFIYNNTVHDITANNSVVVAGIASGEWSDNESRNNIVTDVVNSGAGTDLCIDEGVSYDGDNAYNCSTDSTATGTGSLNDSDGISSSDLFVSNSGPSFDLTLKSTADPAGAGTDLSSKDWTDIEKDIESVTRSTWDMGAYIAVDLGGGGDPFLPFHHRNRIQLSLLQR